MTLCDKTYEAVLIEIIEMKGPIIMKVCSLGDMKIVEMKGPKVMKGCFLGAMKINEMKDP